MWPYKSQLTRIERKLDQLLEGEERIMSTQADLDQALNDLGLEVTDVTNAITALESKASAQPDLAPEVATLTKFRDALKAAADSTNPAPPPPPAPPV